MTNPASWSPDYKSGPEPRPYLASELADKAADMHRRNFDKANAEVKRLSARVEVLEKALTLIQKECVGSSWARDVAESALKGTP